MPPRGWGARQQPVKAGIWMSRMKAVGSMSSSIISNGSKCMSSTWRLLKKGKNIINIKQFEIPYCGFIWPGNKIIHMYFSLVKIHFCIWCLIVTLRVNDCIYFNVVSLCFLWRSFLTKFKNYFWANHLFRIAELQIRINALSLYIMWSCSEAGLV